MTSQRGKFSFPGALSKRSQLMQQMRIRTLMIGALLILGTARYFCQGQNPHDPFIGILHLGTGVSSIYDFNWDYPNGADIPFQLGLKTIKYVSKKQHLEFGVLLSKRGASYRKVTQYSSVRSGREWYPIRLFYIDIPVSFHFTNDLFKYGRSMYLIGLSPGYLAVPASSNSISELHSEYVRSFFISAFFGVSYKMKSPIRWTLILNQSLTSVIRPEYREEFEDGQDVFGRNIVPVELMLSFGYILN